MMRDGCVDLAAYHMRIVHDGAAAAPFDLLCTLIARHQAHIPFEAIDVMLGRAIDLDPGALADKLVARRRGGYCFEQNCLFQHVLAAHRFDVEALIGRVLWMQQPGDPPRPWTHMALRVTIDAIDYLVDVGFGGCVPPRPLRFDTVDPQPTEHERFRLTPSAEGHMLEALLDGAWAPVYEVARRAVGHDVLDRANRSVWSDPASHFRHRLMVTKTMAEARHVLFGNRLTIRMAGLPPERVLLSPEALREVLEDRFGLHSAIDWPSLLERVDFRQD